MLIDQTSAEQLEAIAEKLKTGSKSEKKVAAILYGILTAINANEHILDMLYDIHGKFMGAMGQLFDNANASKN